MVALLRITIMQITHNGSFDKSKLERPNKKFTRKLQEILALF